MKVTISWEGVPRNGGLGDDAYEHRRSQVFIEGIPQRIFGYFLCEQKVTPVSL